MIVIKSIKEMPRKEKERLLTEEIEKNEKLIEELQKQINDYKEELKKLNKKFVPYLKYSILTGYEKNFGEIGKKTKLTALFGEELYVGDVVELYDIDGNKIKSRTYICEEEGKAFVMCIANDSYNMKNGIARNWQVRKIKSYKELNHNEEYRFVKAILKEED